MPFVLIKGTVHVRGYSPDGDSIRFAATDPSLFARLSGGPPRMNRQGHVQLRLEGIDTLETHWTPEGGGGVYHQPERWARRAVDRILSFTGIEDVVWDTTRNVVTAARDGRSAYILTRATDKYGRPIAFLGAGDPGGSDGSDVRLDSAGLAATYNHAALSEGLAYPTFYQQLFSDLRQALTDAAVAARAGDLGLWSHDRTTAGFDASGLAVITDEVAILPKLFRRLAAHMVATGSALGFREVLAASQEPVLDLRDSNFTHLDTFVEQEGTRLRMTRQPEELVYDPMPLRPADHFARLLATVESPLLPPVARFAA